VRPLKNKSSAMKRHFSLIGASDSTSGEHTPKSQGRHDRWRLWFPDPIVRRDGSRAGGSCENTPYWLFTIRTIRQSQRSVTAGYIGARKKVGIIKKDQPIFAFEKIVTSAMQSYARWPIRICLLEMRRKSRLIMNRVPFWPIHRKHYCRMLH